MARVVEDIGSENGSDDEFPSVEELVATRGKKTLVAKERVTSVSNAAKTRSLAKRNMRIGEFGEGGKEVGGGGMGEGKAKGMGTARKRVLNQKSDNPLLRPFDSASSDLPGEPLRRKGRGLDSRRQTLAKKDGNVLEKVPRGRSPEQQHEATREDITTQQKNNNPIQSIEPEIGDRSRVRKAKSQAKNSSTKQVGRPKNEEAKENKEYERTRSTHVESNEFEDENFDPFRKPSKHRQVRNTAERPRKSSSPKVESEEEDFGLDSDGLSDFIVDDSTFMEEEDTVIEEPAPRSVRRLVKGRRPNRIEESDDEDLDPQTGKLKVEESTANTLEKALKELNLDDSDDEDLPEAKTRKNPKDIQHKVPRRNKDDKATLASSDIEEPFTLH